VADAPPREAAREAPLASRDGCCARPGQTQDVTTTVSATPPIRIDPGEPGLISRNPRTGAEHRSRPATPLESVEAACRAARTLFDGAADAAATATATVLGTAPDSAGLLRALATELTGATEELVPVADAETALGEVRLRGEIARTAFQLRAFADLVGSPALLDPVLDTADAHRVPPRADQRSLQIPLGPVAVFAASNFPFAFGVLGGDTASALAAGCPVVAEAHPAQPETSALLAEVARRAVRTAGVPEAWLQVVQGAGAEAGQALVTAPGISAVGFTGSFAGGRALLAAAAQRAEPIPVYAEMGSLNPVFVGAGALAERPAELADAWVATLTTNAGQLCTKPGLLVVTRADGPGRGIAADFEASVGRALAAATVPPMLAPRLRDGLRGRWADLAAVPGARTLLGTAPEPAGPAAPGLEQQAGVVVVDAARVLATPTVLEEAFGPVGVLVVAESPAQALELARALPGSLTASVHLGNGDDAWGGELLAVLRNRAGRLVVDGWPTGVSVGWATVHGGPWPATSAPATTSVGLGAARRFTRPVAFQGVPDRLLPPELQDANPRRLLRRIDGVLSDRDVRDDGSEA
jgi:NADP-dependent aldehyde dehydrogenase